MATAIRTTGRSWPLALARELPVWSQDKGLAAAGLQVFTTGRLLDLLRETGAL